MIELSYGATTTPIVCSAFGQFPGGAANHKQIAAVVAFVNARADG